MSRFTDLIEPQTNEVEFRGETLEIKKLPFVVVSEFISAVQEESSTSAVRKNLENMILIIKHGLVDSGGCEDLIRNADSELFVELSELVNKILVFSGVLIEDEEESVATD
jgi:hypothetical protein